MPSSTSKVNYMDIQRVECHLDGARAVKDRLITSAILIAVFRLSSHLNVLEHLTKFSRRYKRLQLDEGIIALLALSLPMTIFSAHRLQKCNQDGRACRRAEETRRCHEARFR